MPLDTRLPLTEAGREQIKLRATFLNGIAIAIFAVGTLGPITKALLESPSGDAVTALNMVFAAICLIVVGILHFVAYRHLKELDR